MSRRRHEGDSGYKLPERGMTLKDLRIARAEANGIWYDICHNYNGQGCHNGGKDVKDKNDPSKIFKEGQEGCCWSLSGATLRAHACTRCGQWGHCAFDCKVHVDSLPPATVTTDNMQRVMTGHDPSRFRDDHGNLPAGHRERQH